MRDKEGFDLWAEGYDGFVAASADSGTYPFAGYRDVLGRIYEKVTSSGAENALELGFGTGTLAKRLYDGGIRVYGQDFSARMTLLAREKMPEAELYVGDLKEGLAPELKRRRYDAVISTYCLHHLSMAEKLRLFGELTPLLSEKGRIYVGDIAFFTLRELEKCAERAGEEWDSEEFYFVTEELEAALGRPVLFEPMSFCAGVITVGGEK